MAISALLFMLVPLAPPKASAAVEIFLTIDGIKGENRVQQISSSSEIYNAVETIASIVLL
jgi:hypothetical protein